MGKNEHSLIGLLQAPMQASARVLEARPGGSFVVEVADGRLAALRAASCALVPCVGDKVWVVGDVAEGLFITSVLVRADSASPPAWVLPAGSVVEAQSGALTLRGAGLNLDADRLCVQAREGAVAVGRVTGTAREMRWSVGTMRVVANLLESVADRLLQRAGTSQRTVEGLDQVRSGHIDYRAEDVLQLHGRDLVASARGLAKVDAEQIHLG